MFGATHENNHSHGIARGHQITAVKIKTVCGSQCMTDPTTVGVKNQQPSMLELRVKMSAKQYHVVFL